MPVNEVSITAEPNSEQDVVALFNQLVAGGVIRGLRLMASSSHRQYDGLYRYHLRKPLANHIYDAVANPLGILDPQHAEDFCTIPHVLEFKHSFDSLIVDFENGEKTESSVSLAICWYMGTRYAERYRATSLLLPENLHLRQFHGVTHQLHDDATGEHRMDLIVLSDLLSYLNDQSKEVAAQRKKVGQ